MFFVIRSLYDYSNAAKMQILMLLLGWNGVPDEADVDTVALHIVQDTSDCPHAVFVAI